MTTSIQRTNSPASGNYHLAFIKKDSPFWNAIEKIFREVITPLYGNQDRTLRKIKDGKDWTGEVLFKGETPAGLLVYKNALQKKEKNEEPSIFTLKYCHTLAEGHGGNELVSRIKKIARKTHAESIEVTLSKTEKKLAEVFLNRDFKILSTFFSDNGSSQYLLSCPLKEKRKKEEVATDQVSKKREREDEEITPSKKRGTELQYQQAVAQQIFSPPRPTSQFTGTSRTCTLMRKYIQQIQSGKKTVEGRVNSPFFKNWKVGDRVKFFGGGTDVTCQIMKINLYRSFRGMLEKEGVSNCLADVTSLDEATHIYDKIPGYNEKAQRFGVLGVQIKVIR